MMYDVLMMYYLTKFDDIIYKTIFELFQKLHLLISAK